MAPLYGFPRSIGYLVILCALSAGLWGGALTPSHASPMSAEEFDAYTQGKTLIYGAGGQPYGAEQYRDGRRVIWSFLDGQCQEGQWYAQADQICFVYDTPSGAAPVPQCWVFAREASGLRATFVGPGSDTTLYEISESATPLLCYGPEVGV